MKQIPKILAEAERFRSRRRSLAAALLKADTDHQARLSQAEGDHSSARKNLEDSRKSACDLADSKAAQTIADFSRKKADLQSFLDPVLSLCPKEERRRYLANPARFDEAAVNALIAKIQEQGILAWLKRLLGLGGYRSRQEMALDVYRQIMDACAYCDERIDAAERERDHILQSQSTQTRRKGQELDDQYLQKQQALDQQHSRERQSALAALKAFDSSRELQSLRETILKMQTEALNACGSWGEYRIPDKMPEKVFFCEVTATIPDNTGVDRSCILPLWLDLFSSNIVVLTTDGGAAGKNEDKAKLLVRKFLARMLKTVPPEWVSYSVFDAQRKGASLERLIDVTSAGTTDLSFDLFTSEERTGGTVSCADRRAFLRQRIAEIMRSIAGKCNSLYEFNRKVSHPEYPFHWLVDFSFPSQPDQRLLAELRELLLNASAAGYSFIFVTSTEGCKAIEALAKAHTHIPVLRLDCDKLTLTQGSFTAPIVNKSAPSSDQIYNFTTALKKFYESGNTVDNHLATVLGGQGIATRDASRKLTIPFALDSRGRLIDLELGGAAGTHGFISGGTGSGKSVLLHSVILSACLHYSPEDLNIWLVDYKQTEFHLYKQKTPPHIKLIGVSKTDDFTFSLLDKIWEEGERRTRLMNRFNVQNLSDYRRHAGEPGYEPLPRLFIVIDEFHEMSQFVSGVAEYKDKLENILREYRAQGLNLLLADQTFSSGLAGLSPAAKGQIAVRIAMRNEVAPDELKSTLEVDRALYSDSMERTISLMTVGDFIMKQFVRNGKGELIDIRLEKFKALYATGADVLGVGKALRSAYKGRFNKQDLLYVNTKDQAPWSDREPAALDRLLPVRYPNIRLYLGRSAALLPCFGVDMGRQPNENMSIVGGTAFQRWELIEAILESCRLRNYRLLVFMAEYCDIFSDHGAIIRAICQALPNAELMETREQWCSKLLSLQEAMENRSVSGDTVCLFLGLEIAARDFANLPDQAGAPAAGPSRFAQTAGFSGGNPFVSGGNPFASGGGNPFLTGSTPAASGQPTEFNAMPLIDQLFREGPRNGIRCITEVSVWREFSKILKLRDMCRHKIAFSMGSDDCLQYLGSSRAQGSIGQFALYSDSGREFKKLLPYKLER